MAGDRREGASIADSLDTTKLLQLVAGAGIGTWCWSAAEQVFTFDDRCKALHDIANDGLAEISWLDFIEQVHPDDRQSLASQFVEGDALAFQDLEYRSQRVDGSMRNLSLCQSLTDEAQGLVYGTCLEVKASRRIHEQSILAQKMEAVGQLTAGISHNFNNILSAILPNLQLAAQHVGAGGEKYLRNAQLAAERASGLVSELMVVAGRRDAVAEEAFDLDVMAERVVRICKTTFGSWIQLEFDSDDDSHVILGNEGHLEQVLLNILLNARDALEAVPISCPRIVIQLEARKAKHQRPEEVILRVTDNGPGMTSEILERIFEPFYTSKGAGTGLGLATAYAIVHKHGGTIRCKSEPKLGAEFEIVLPAFAGAAKTSPTPVATLAIGGTETILVVDDDPLVRSVVSAALQNAGYQVVQAVGGNEAIAAQANQGDFDLVVLDMSMPELSGDQVLIAMRSRDPLLKVLIFTGVSDASVAQPDVPFLQKPAGVNELLVAVRQALDTVRSAAPS